MGCLGFGGSQYILPEAYKAHLVLWTGSPVSLAWERQPWLSSCQSSHLTLCGLLGGCRPSSEPEMTKTLSKATVDQGHTDQDWPRVPLNSLIL